MPLTIGVPTDILLTTYDFSKFNLIFSAMDHFIGKNWKKLKFMRLKKKKTGIYSRKEIAFEHTQNNRTHLGKQLLILSMFVLRLSAMLHALHKYRQR